MKKYGLALEMVAEISVAVEDFGAAEAAAGLFLLDVLRKNVSEFAAMLDVSDFEHGTGLVLRMNFDGTQPEELLTQRALYADILHSVEKNLILIGVEKTLLVDELFGCDRVSGKRPGQSEKLASLAFLDKYRILLNLFLCHVKYLLNKQYVFYDFDTPYKK